MTGKMDQPELSELFARHGLRCTRQRKAVYHALARTCDHPTADQLHRQLTDRGQSMSLATVYNTLEALCKSGLAQRLSGNGPLTPDSTGNTSGSGSRYDATLGDHVHIRCACTGKLHDVPHGLGQKFLDAIPKRVLEEIEHDLGVKVDHLQIELVAKPAQ